jgi:predicted hydrocarbon binding protein
MMIPFSVERFMFYRGRKLYGFVVEGISRPGVIATVTGIVAEKGLDITYYAAGTVRRGERGMGIFFVDFTGSTVKPEDLVEEFRDLDFVTSVKVIRPTIEGFIADDVAFPVMLGPHRAIIFSEPALRGFLIDFRKHLGSGGEAMLYYLGREVGAERARYIDDEAERIGATSVGDKFAIGAKIFMSLGYGVLEILELREEPPYLRVRIYHSIECELGRGAGRTFSHYVRGTLAGFATELFKREMFAEEVRCIAQGDSLCEFDIKPKKKTP